MKAFVLALVRLATNVAAAVVQLTRIADVAERWARKERLPELPLEAVPVNAPDTAPLPPRLPEEIAADELTDEAGTFDEELRKLL
jgi:hypothetical protein